MHDKRYEIALDDRSSDSPFEGLRRHLQAKLDRRAQLARAEGRHSSLARAHGDVMRMTRNLAEGDTLAAVRAYRCALAELR